MSLSSNLSAQILETASLQSSANLCWLIFGSISLICNTLIVITIAISKSLHVRNQFLLANLAGADILYDISFVVCGSMRYLTYSKNWPENENITNCLGQLLYLTTSFSVMTLMTLALGVDRCICVAKPIFYHRNSKSSRYFILLNSLIWSYSVSRALFAYFSRNFELTIPACSVNSAFNSVYVTAQSIESTIKSAAVPAVYVLALLILWRRLAETKNWHESQRRERRLKLELSIFRMFMVITVVYLITSFTSSYSYVILNNMPSWWSKRLSPFFGMLFMLNSSSHLFIYLFMSRQFRSAFADALCCGWRWMGGNGHKTQVVPAIRINGTG